eukprot:6941644-Pyramimonas_sp.AAC.1
MAGGARGRSPSLGAAVDRPISEPISQSIEHVNRWNSLASRADQRWNLLPPRNENHVSLGGTRLSTP